MAALPKPMPAQSLTLLIFTNEVPELVERIRPLPLSGTQTSPPLLGATRMRSEPQADRLLMLDHTQTFACFLVGISLAFQMCSIYSKHIICLRCAGLGASERAGPVGIYGKKKGAQGSSCRVRRT